MTATPSIKSQRSLSGRVCRKAMNSSRSMVPAPGGASGFTFMLNLTGHSTCLLSHGLGHGAAGQHADEMCTVFGAAMDVAAHAVGRHGQSLQRLRPEPLLE